MDIRPFKAGDGEMFYEFLAALSDKTKYFFLPHPCDRETAEALTSAPALYDTDTPRFAAVEDGRMLGYCFFKFYNAPLPIFAVCVRDGYQNCGRGRELVLDALARARADGKDGVRLTTFKDNLRAQHLYKSCGYIIKGTDAATGEWELFNMFSRPMPAAWECGNPRYE